MEKAVASDPSSSTRNGAIEDLSSTPSSSQPKVCAVCGEEARKTCSGCGLASYCGVEHQKADWGAHRPSCSSVILRTSSDFGRHFVAARKLKAGTLLFREPPLLVAPRGLVDSYDNPVCLSCSVLMENEKSEYRCSKCNWPTCSWTCEQHKFHAESECRVFVEKKVPYPPPGEYPVYVTYKAIEIARGILSKNSQPETWKKLMDLQHVSDLGSKTKLFEDLPKLRKTFGMDDLGTDEDWYRMLRILNVNGFSMEGNRGTESPSFTGFVFEKSSMLVHSCAPNCWWGVSVFPQCQMEIRTTVDVLKGEILSIPYTYLFNSFGTHKRQELLQEDGEFVCKCKRCLDPTELSSFCSALVCLSCKTGSVLPLDPLEVKSDWKCIDCEAVVKFEDINVQLEDLMSKLEQCETIADMEMYIVENQGVTVHKNHWLITEAEDVICKDRAKSSWNREEELSLEDRDKHIQYCSHFLSVKDIVAPGISLERSRLLNHLARAKLEKLDFLIREKLLTDQDKVAEEVNTICHLYQESLLFYKVDPTERLVTERYGLKARTILSDMEFVKAKFQAGSPDTPDSADLESGS